MAQLWGGTSTPAYGTFKFCPTKPAVNQKLKCSSHGHLANYCLLIREVFRHCLFLGHAEAAGIKQSFVSTENSTQLLTICWRQGLAFSASMTAAVTFPSAEPGARMLAKFWNTYACSSVAGWGCRELSWQNWDAGMGNVDKMPRKQWGSHDTGRQRTPAVLISPTWRKTSLHPASAWPGAKQKGLLWQDKG